MSISKKFLSKVLLLAGAILLVFSLVPKVKIAKAMELTNDKFDQMFIATVEEYISDNCSGAINLKANKEIIYDIDLNEFGYIYDFVFNEEKGYATIVDTKGYPEVAEIYFNSLNPFESGDYLRIYIGNAVYAFYKENSFYFSTGEEISDESLAVIKEFAYYSNDPDIITESETIYYITKVETDSAQLAKRHPSVNTVTHANGCVPIAGANIIQFWDRYFPNLIENYTPGMEVGAYYLYYLPNRQVNEVTEELYSLMGTNTNGDGTSIEQFKSGMARYCSNKGYKISYESCMSLGKFSYSKAKEKIKNGRPLIIFNDLFTLATITSMDNSDQINYIKINAPHAMVGFGFKDIRYTLTNGETRIDNYLEVASGLMEYSNGYYNINYETIIDDTYGVYIS